MPLIVYNKKVRIEDASGKDLGEFMADYGSGVIHVVSHEAFNGKLKVTLDDGRVFDVTGYGNNRDKYTLYAPI